MKESKIFRYRAILFFLFVLILGKVIHRFFLIEHLNIENVRSIFGENLYSSCFLFIGLFSLGNLLQIPGQIFLTAAVLVLGRNQGYLLTLIAAYISCALSFFCISSIAGDSLKEIKFKWVKKILAQLDDKPFLVVLLLRFIFQTAPALNYALSMSGVSFKNYILATIVALPIPVYIYTLVIDSLSKGSL